MIKVAIDIGPLETGHAVRGVGAYTKSLVEAFGKLKIKNEKLKIDAFNFKTQNSKLKTQNYDLIHYPHFDLFFLTLPWRKPIKTIVTIHDVIPLVFPKHYPSGIRGKIKFLIQKSSLKSASAVITDSQNSKRDIVEYLGFPEEKIYVVSLAPSGVFKPEKSTSLLHRIKVKYKLPEEFILYVGDVNWNKNIPGLLRAFYKLKTPSQKLKLVFVGKAFLDESLPEVCEILQLIKVLKLEDRVIRLGWIPEEDLVKIYNLAQVYCQPSFYEGFGLPVLEAMACGCPVVASKTSSLPEICGEGALMVNPNKTEKMVEALERAIVNTKARDALIRKGFEQVKKFSWEKTAKETMDVYKKVA
ncbi:MAG: glycosyltransferase family 4 protein [Patescibacteria group bacterium]